VAPAPPSPVRAPRVGHNPNARADCERKGGYSPLPTVDSAIIERIEGTNN